MTNLNKILFAVKIHIYREHQLRLCLTSLTLFNFCEIVNCRSCTIMVALYNPIC